MFKIRLLVTALTLAGSISVATAWDALPTTAPAPADNPTTEEKVELGSRPQPFPDCAHHQSD